MAPVLIRSLGASSVAALRPSPSFRLLPRAALVPQGRAAAARGVRWEAGRRRIVRVGCDAAVAEKPTEEETAGEKFEYQAEVCVREIVPVWWNLGLGVPELSLWDVCSMLLHFVMAKFAFRDIEDNPVVKFCFTL